MAVAQAIKRARVGAHTQESLALEIGSDQATISRWETGKQDPTVDEIVAVEDACHKPRGWILVSAGLVADGPSVELSIAADPQLDENQRQFLLNAYSAALALSATAGEQ